VFQKTSAATQKNVKRHAFWILKKKLQMWGYAQLDGRPAKYRWRPLFNAEKFG